MVILDTCAIIEAVKKKPAFSMQTEKQIEAGAYILSISFAEIACKVSAGKLIMDISTEALFNAFNQIETIQFIDISASHWLDSIALKWPESRDPADRLITAFASKNQIAIVTSDKKIKKFYKKVIW